MMTRDAFVDASVADIALGAGLVASKGVCTRRATFSRLFACVELSTHATPCLRVPAEAKRLTKAGGLYLNNERVENAAKPPSLDDLIDGTVCLLRSGKRKNVLVRVEA